jgi:methionyl-tRNA formyltransferase
MKVLFIGSVEFSKHVLEKLISINSEIVGVCAKKTSTFNADFFDLKPLCDKNLIPCHYTNEINSLDSQKWIIKKQPDIIFCMGWSNLLREKILSIPSMGVIGYHPAKLPYNRGRHPLIWPIILGMNQVSSTFFFMDKGTDSGDILSQVDFEISYWDDSRSLYDKTINIALEQIDSFYQGLVDGQYSRTPQNHSLSNVWRRRYKSDGIIDFRMNSRAIYNLVRALTKPYIGAHIEYKGEDVKIWKVKELMITQNNIEPGKVLEVAPETLIVKTMDGAIKILDHEFESLPNKGDYL